MASRTFKQQVAAELTATDLDWALIGGLAISARLEPRFTRDVDLVVAPAGRERRPETVTTSMATAR